jgi:hypothetical protein
MSVHTLPQVSFWPEACLQIGGFAVTIVIDGYFSEQCKTKEMVLSAM